MQLRFDPLEPGEVSLLGRFLAASDWPYHHEAQVDASWVRARVESGQFFGGDSKSFWIREAGLNQEEPIAFVRVFDLSDVTPLLDLRVARAARGRGLGTLALRGVTAWFFSEYAEAERLGGYTRFDNVAMRRVFEKCGFAQEAHHRRAWRVAGAEPVDCVGYAVLRGEVRA